MYLFSRSPDKSGTAWAVTKDQGVLRFDGHTWSQSFPLPDQFFAMSRATTPTGALVVVGFHGKAFDSERGEHSVSSRDGALLVMATGSLQEQVPK